jgi:hypothetical protein
MSSRRTAASSFTQPNPMSTGQSLGGITERTAKLKSRSAQINARKGMHNEETQTGNEHP